MTASRHPIRPLSDHQINRIAAGEVIERPASVLKELIENSLDAHARHVYVDLIGGGIDLTSVRDDGHGIRGHELSLALERHCTSKIDDAHALVAIESLGFRGEALASIAAVADVVVSSRVDDEPHGWMIRRTAGGPALAAEPHGHPRGTQVEVRGLFHNTPGRRRFLKRPLTEYQHIYQLVRRLGFCRPDVAFELTHDGRRTLALPIDADAGSGARRRRQLFGAGFAAAAQWLDTCVEDLRIFGWVGGPSEARTQTDLQFMAVNGRAIRDRQLAHAIRLAFEERLPLGRFPAYAIHITAPLGAVDVNVHPGKAEVRFANLREVHDLLYSAIRRALDAGKPEIIAAPVLPAAWAPSAGHAVNEPRTPAGRAARGPGSGYAAASPVRVVETFGRVIATVEARFVLTDGDDGLQVVDLRGLLQRIAVERLTAAVRAGGVAGRPLLIAEAISWPVDGPDEHRARRLADCGIEVDVLGPRSAVLRSLPVVFPELDTAEFARRLAVLLASGDDISPAGLAGLAAESARFPPSERRCAELLDSLAAAARVLQLALDDYCACVDGRALRALLATPERRAPVPA